MRVCEAPPTSHLTVSSFPVCAAAWRHDMPSYERIRREAPPSSTRYFSTSRCPPWGEQTRMLDDIDSRTHGLEKNAFLLAHAYRPAQRGSTPLSRTTSDCSPSWKKNRTKFFSVGECCHVAGGTQE